MRLLIRESLVDARVNRFAQRKGVESVGMSLEKVRKLSMSKV